MSKKAKQNEANLETELARLEAMAREIRCQLEESRLADNIAKAKGKYLGKWARDPDGVNEYIYVTGVVQEFGHAVRLVYTGVTPTMQGPRFYHDQGLSGTSELPVPDLTVVPAGEVRKAVEDSMRKYSEYVRSTMGEMGIALGK